MYASERKREAARVSVGSVEDWLMSLGIRVQVDTLNPSNLARVTQLFNKTNQLNLTTRRLTEAELVAFDAQGDAQLFAVSVSDRFGDAGLTGILGMQQEGSVARVTDFILSCRVMGRRVEETLVHLAVEWARQRNLELVDAHYLPTKKNKPCLDFWQRSGCEPADEGHFVWRADAPYVLPACIALSVNV
jgi:FkbH-like protein